MPSRTFGTNSSGDQMLKIVVKQPVPLIIGHGFFPGFHLWLPALHPAWGTSPLGPLRVRH